MGLAFEAPVAVLNVREFLVVFDLEAGGAFARIARSARAEQAFAALWDVVLALTVVCRFGPTAIYVWALLWWRDEVAAAAPEGSTFFLYHAFGLAFSAVNVAWWGLLHLWRRQDITRIVKAKEADCLSADCESAERQTDVEIRSNAGAPGASGRRRQLGGLKGGWGRRMLSRTSQ